MASFGDFIKQEREKNGWTQTDFGAKIGINSSAVSRIEHGTKQISSNKLNTLSGLFSVELSKIKELYFADKFARDVYKFDCPNTVFMAAEEEVRYLRNKNAKQSKINF
ncbi:helix-turn-helix transcriptional regulator [Mucilaginibacter sp.]|uniref:helix-turn-helix domain-containing protein n=1 Tax=Mucilaginibacter sp. TaxID=1882438 RepID=UPI002846646F|nr:helix-turn-helix transcriptional regulator [Mucilaginibacter sp.]MDR3695385.1 helix-turn-helix transcriptional regulator [Mucilaginibacter sp.]